MNARIIEQVDLNKGLLIRLLPGDSFFKAITGILGEKGIQHGAFLSAIGSLKDVSYRNLQVGAGLPISLEKTVLGEAAGPFELLSLEGTFVPKEDGLQFNVHVMLGTEDGSVIGGHLFEATVYTTLEIVLVELGGSRVHKEETEQTGLYEWRLQSS
jgi:predicted DNA-binding protein with PD1-like motif